MQAFVPSHHTLGEPAGWTSAPIDIPVVSQFPGDALPGVTVDSMFDPQKQGVRARNRVTAKPWRERKDETLSELEAVNDSAPP
jgi:hypothetical protein